MSEYSTRDVKLRSEWYRGVTAEYKAGNGLLS